MKTSQLKRAAIALSLAAIGSACTPTATNTPPPEVARDWPQFVNAGKREFPNGTEIYVLDSKSGQVCYYFIAIEGKGDTMNCAGRALKQD